MVTAYDVLQKEDMYDCSQPSRNLVVAPKVDGTPAASAKSQQSSLAKGGQRAESRVIGRGTRSAKLLRRGLRIQRTICVASQRFREPPMRNAGKAAGRLECPARAFLPDWTYPSDPGFLHSLGTTHSGSRDPKGARASRSACVDGVGDNGWRPSFRFLDFDRSSV